MSEETPFAQHYLNMDTKSFIEGPTELLNYLSGATKPTIRVVPFYTKDFVLTGGSRNNWFSEAQLIYAFTKLKKENQSEESL